MKRIVLFSAILSLVLMNSCKVPENLTYLEQADIISAEQLQQSNQRMNPELGPGDLLNIRVYAPNMVSVAQFNKGMTLTPDGKIASYNSGNSTSHAEASTDYYLVNSDGYIEFPVLGSLKVTGKTKEQLANEIKNLIYPKYVTTPPTVEIRLMNFKVTVLGAVRSPGVVTSNNERMNILEAIASVGDLDIKGQRENILLYRTNTDGSREVHRLNLNDRNLLLSPYFNLQQNDFIYVEPNQYAKQNSWSMPQAWTVGISVVGGLSSVVGLIFSIINFASK